LSLLQAEVIADLGSAAPIEDEWRRLASIAGNAFVTPEWYSAWAEGAVQHEPRIVVARRAGGEVAGVIPLALYEGKRLQAIRFGGSEYGDNFGVASEPGDQGDVAEAAAEALQNELGSSLLVLHWVDRDTDWPERLATASARRLALIEQNQAEMPRARVAGLDWEGYLAERSTKFRQRVGRGLERALDREGIEHQVRETSDPNALEADLATLFDLHDRRHAEGDSSIAAPAVRDFLTRFARAAMNEGWLRLRILELDGTPAAAYLAWRIGPRYAVYQSGFDPAFAEQSAGMTLLNDTTRSAIGEQVDDVDLLLGGEAFKWRFAPEPRPVRTVALVGARRPARLLVAGEAAARRRGRGLAKHPRLEKVARSVARLLPGGRSG
jgi:CelD/BcsL family acetyltransferase involved in cellulose biosynthesis